MMARFGAGIEIKDCSKWVREDDGSAHVGDAADRRVLAAVEPKKTSS